MMARRGSAVAVALTVVTVAVMLLFIMFAARSGPHSLVNGTLRDPRFLRPLQSPGHIHLHQPNGRAGHAPPARGGAIFEAVVWGVRLVLALVFLLLVGRVAWWVVQSVGPRLRSAPRAEDVEFAMLEDPEQVADAIRDDADDQFALLLGGTPRNAIVACWDRFEDQAERVGAARKPWETSSEFTLRLLEGVQADPPAVSRLEMLYREARFSRHEITESHRDSAVEALETIHRSLDARVGPG